MENNAMNYHIEVTLTGDVSPTTFRSAELAKMLTAVESLIASLIENNFPELNLRKEDIVVGLTQIKAGSVSTLYETNCVEQTQAIMLHIEDVLTRGKSDMFVEDGMESLKQLQNLTKRYKGTMRFADVNGTRRELGELTPHTSIKISDTQLKSDDVLYGTVMRIGGETPRVTIRLLNGDVLNCHISEVGDNRIAKELAKRLYSVVGVSGHGTRHSRSMRLSYFMIEEILPYQDTPPNLAFAEIANSIRHILEPMGADAYWAHLEEYGED
jgi:hypothetical protein